MLDTCIGSLIMPELGEAVLKGMEQAVVRCQRIVVSAITYAEMCFGTIGLRASPNHNLLVDAFCFRFSTTTYIRGALRIEPNDTAVPGYGSATDAVQVTNNTRKSERMPDLMLEDHK